MIGKKIEGRLRRRSHLLPPIRRDLGGYEEPLVIVRRLELAYFLVTVVVGHSGQEKQMYFRGDCE